MGRGEGHGGDDVAGDEARTTSGGKEGRGAGRGTFRKRIPGVDLELLREAAVMLARALAHEEKRCR